MLKGSNRGSLEIIADLYVLRRQRVVVLAVHVVSDCLRNSTPKPHRRGCGKTERVGANRSTFRRFPDDGLVVNGNLRMNRLDVIFVLCAATARANFVVRRFSLGGNGDAAAFYVTFLLRYVTTLSQIGIAIVKIVDNSVERSLVVDV